MIQIFGHKNPDTDSICSAIACAYLKNSLGLKATAYRLGKINRETQFALTYFDVPEPPLLDNNINDEKPQVILVDHNDIAQSVSWLKDATILEIIDHHRLCGLETAAPLHVTIMPVGCTSTILYNQYKNNNIDIPQNIAGLMLSAILSDTLIFNSPTATSADIEAANILGKLADIESIKDFGLELQAASASLKGYSVEELLELDRKKSVFGGNLSIFVSQINTLEFDKTMELEDKLLQAMEKHLKTAYGDLSLLMITDLKRNSSQLLIQGKERDLARAAFNMKKDENSIYVEGLVSRKTQVTPILKELATKVL